MSNQNNNSRNIDPEKITAERLNGYAALFGCIALIFFMRVFLDDILNII